jgi:hypothetical protein
VITVASDQACRLTVGADVVGAGILLTPHGVLDSTTYLTLRDEIIKAALDAPRGVIVDVSDLNVPAPSAWAVFTSARWHVDRWPEIPILLVCGHVDGRSAIARNGVARYVPVFENVDAAVGALWQWGSGRHRHRARAGLGADLRSLARARELVEWWLTAWSRPELIAVAKVIVTALVENVLQHTDGPPNLRLETDGVTVTVAVEDTSRSPAGIRERWPSAAPSGLHIVDALCRTWGNSPMPSGKTVWAVLGPENQL